MATFQGDDREDDVQVRSQRVRQLPRHLGDYELGFPAKQLPPFERHLHQATESQSASQLVPADFITPVPTLQRTDKEEQWHHIEARCNDLTKQLQELQLEMDSVKRLPYPQSAPAYQPSYPLSYHHYPPQYTSLPRLTLDSPAGSHRSTPVHSPARYTTAAGEELLQQPVSQRGSPSRQPSLLPQTGEPRAQDKAILTQPVHQASAQVPMDKGWISNHNSALHTPHRQDGRPPRSAPQPIMPQALPAQPVNHPLPVQPSNPLRPTHYSLPPSIQYQSYPQYPAYPPEVYPPGGYYLYYTSLPPATHMPPMPSLAPYRQPVPPRGPTAPGILEMAIASSYGIPKPKLIPFSSGKESDFIMMKKGLYSVLSPHKHLTKDYKYQVLLDLLKLPNAYQVAKRYVNDPTPYSSAMHALEQRYGQPRQLVQGELKAILNSPPIKPGDAQALEDFSSAVSTLVGLLSTIDGSSRAELRCGSHVDTLLSKLPATYRDRFAEHCISKGIIRSGSDRTYTLPDFADWLERKAQAIQVARHATEVSKPEVTQPERKNRTAKPQQSKFATIYVTNQPESSEPPQSSVTSTASSNPGQASKKQERFKPYCPYCSNQEHYLSACTEFAKLSTAEKGDWIKEKSKCWRCGRGHKPESCTLKKPCSTCNEQHLLVLHEVATKACQSLFTFTAPSSMVYGPTNFLQTPSKETSCLHAAFQSPNQDLLRHVEMLWQVDTLPFRSEKEATRSKQDQLAVNTLDQRTVRVTVDGIACYATPLLRKPVTPKLHAPPLAVMPLLRATERRLTGNPDLAKVYNEEIHKLDRAGYVIKISSDEASQSEESWYIPHHIVHHNGKARVVFNCSFKFQQTALNDILLPGPNLGASLLGVLLRFREYLVAISGDIRGMFHQIRLLPEDQPLLRFLWRDMEKERSPDIYEWRVLPFGTACSPCCAIYALQQHVKTNSTSYEEVLNSVNNTFYVDNCLQSLRTPLQARQLNDKMRVLLVAGGFDMRQWASNRPEVIAHLPSEARSEGCELWLTAERADPQESTLGLRWHCPSDTLGYKYRQLVASEPTLRNVYRVLASQYDPLGYIIPYTTGAKVLIQALWRHEQQWDKPITGELLSVWQNWESELPHLQHISMPRCYMPVNMSADPSDLHVFCDASEKAYGSVAYLRMEDTERHPHVSFVMARSRVAPWKQLSMPHLELSAALTGAQLAKLLHSELTLTLRHTVMWSDSTIVLSWIRSDSAQYKVFVGTRIAEIQEHTDASDWRYVPSDQNPADDITRGKSLHQLAQPSRWNSGPAFLYEPSSHWPENLVARVEDTVELRKYTFCGQLAVPDTCPDPLQYDTWSDLVDATYQSQHGVAAASMSASARINTEVALLKRAQADSFPEELSALQHDRPIRPSSRLISLSPEYDYTLGLIRVGGRLRKADDLPKDSIHPIVLAPDHPIMQLLVKDYDDRLLHAGPERVFAEIRRVYWILRGRQAIRKHQRHCVECRRWRSKPTTPKMADLPAACLRLNKPPFWSTGVDCFGPYTVKIGRRQEKRWGIIFKCLTSRCVHLELMPSMDTDSFLLALRRFIARRGKPYEILCDRGTNFRGGKKELQQAFEALEPSLKE
ncbi:hypothetical protein MHYP_G00152810 [Metynnis hypsauchen]